MKKNYTTLVNSFFSHSELEFEIKIGRLDQNFQISNFHLTQQFRFSGQKYIEIHLRNNIHFFHILYFNSWF